MRALPALEKRARSARSTHRTDPYRAARPARASSGWGEDPRALLPNRHEPTLENVLNLVLNLLSKEVQAMPRPPSNRSHNAYQEKHYQAGGSTTRTSRQGRSSREEKRPQEGARGRSR